MKRLYLNGVYYGTGDLPYMHELITSHMMLMDELGEDTVTFEIATERKLDLPMVADAVMHKYEGDLKTAYDETLADYVKDKYSFEDVKNYIDEKVKLGDQTKEM